MTSPSPPSLTQLFEAPEDMRGEAGVVCGYSADPRFMDVALERFTRFTSGQRGIEGKLRLALILDPSNPQIGPTRVPGMLHLGIRERRPRFGLLHAKVALLLFRSTDDLEPETWRLRLIVSTGNWTHQTVDQSIDLFWCIEVEAAALGDNTDPMRADAADVVAAWQFLQWILGECCGYVPGQTIGTVPMLDDLDRVVQRIKIVASPELPTRFFDNREDALIDLVVARVAATITTPKRNYLALGSGFFNGAATVGDPGKDAFDTIEAIRKRLVTENLLTGNSALELVVNRNACQGVASAAAKLQGRNWRIREPSYLGQITERFLHAKFAFSAVEIEDKAARPWLYLGSGNMTRQGFMNKAASGNLESGIVLHFKALHWKSKGSPTEAVGYMLPLQWDTELTPADGLQAGDDPDLKDVPFFAAPVAFFSWVADERAGWLLPFMLDESAEPFTLLAADGRPCDAIDGRYPWPGPQPRQVSLRWNENRDAFVPVIGQDGRVAAAPLRPCQLTELWGELEGFPEPPIVEEDEDGEDPDGDPDASSAQNLRAHQTVAGTTLIRTTMDLVERIAGRQIKLRNSDWTAWLVRLEQTLMRATDTIEVAQLKCLQVNPLSPLWEVDFRPAFAQGESKESRDYEKVLARIGSAWEVANLRCIGASR